MYDKIMNAVRRWFKPILIAVIVVVTGYTIWLFTTVQGRLTLDKITGTYAPPPAKHVISIYNNGVKVAEYAGRYSIEEFDGHIVLVDREGGSNVEIYGDSIVILDED